ncbi:MAG: YciI family protein [Chitinophagales bacterium]
MSNQPFPVIYACIWKANETDATFNPQEFEERIPRLMAWLKDLNAKGKLVACGGGGFESHSGGLTLIKANSIEEAIELSNGTPMNEIGKTEIMVWDVYYGNLQVTEREQQLKS